MTAAGHANNYLIKESQTSIKLSPYVMASQHSIFVSDKNPDKDADVIIEDYVDWVVTH